MRNHPTRIQLALVSGIVLLGLVCVLARVALNARIAHTPLARPVASSRADTSILRSEEYGFSLTYPSAFSVNTRSVLDPSYERTFYFRTPTSALLYLQVIDLAKYLATTATPTLAAYLQSLRNLPAYRTTNLDGKVA